MNRPNPKNYYPKDFINGKYQDDLQKYINYLEKKLSVYLEKHQENINIVSWKPSK